MKKPIHFLFLILLIFTFGASHTLKKSIKFPVLRGPYLGQKPPGMTPKIFAPGIISTDMSEGSSGFAHNGTVFVFQRFIDRKCHTYIMRLKNNQWSPPALIPFWKQLIHNGDFVLSPDDRTMFYQVKTEISGRLDSDIWKVELPGREWGARSRLPAPINTSYDESFASQASDGTLYFFSRRPGGVGQSDLYIAQCKNGVYADPINLKVLNTQYHEWDPYIAPDQTYLIFCSAKPGGFGQDDLYISFKNTENQWGDPIHLDRRFNSPRSENRPYITHDGKYFFFTSYRRGNRDIYWVDAKIIKEF